MFMRRSMVSLAAMARRFSSSASGVSITECPHVAKGLVVGMYQKEVETDKPRLTKGGARFDEAHNGKLLELLNKAPISGRLGQEVTFTNMGGDIGTVSVIGIGPDCVGYNDLEAIDVDRESVRVAASIGVRRLERQNVEHILVDGMGFPEQAAEASALTLWKYQVNKMPENQVGTPTVEVYDPKDQAAWAKGMIGGDAQNLVRTLCDTPANQMTPMLFAQSAVETLCPHGITVEVRNMNWIETNGFSGFLSVARSSCEPPVMLELTYCKGMSDEKPIMMVGQGITFNSGGICLKPANGMLEYRANMAGAAMCVAALEAIARLGLSMKISVLIPLCENMPSGMSTKPGDVVTMRNGKSICIHDSNEIGALSIIEALTYGYTLYGPHMVIDVGTFTDEIETSLSGAAAGCFTTSNSMWAHLEKASGLTGDRLWRMPSWNYFQKKSTDYEKYDVSCQGHGGSRGMACKAVALIKEFVPCPDWMHLDVRGVGMMSKNNIYPYCEPGLMSGRPTRTLIQFLSQHSLEELQK